MSDRRDFLMTLGLAGAMPAWLGAASDAPAPLRRALVLSGGGALGSYAAGIIGCLATAAGVKDGAALPPYELVCGTSIGALNGWFVATGQYTKLHDLWYGVSAQNIIQLKPQFAALRDPEAGIGNRLSLQFNMASLAKDQTAFFDSKPVLDWVTRNLDPERPLVMPFVWVATNLTMQRPEYFYMRPANAPAGLATQSSAICSSCLARRSSCAKQVPTCSISRSLRHSRFHCCGIPCKCPVPDGTLNQYCDGGVAANSPVSVAHAVVSRRRRRVIESTTPRDCGLRQMQSKSRPARSARCSRRFSRATCAPCIFSRLQNARLLDFQTTTSRLHPRGNHSSQHSLHRYPQPNSPTFVRRRNCP